MAINRSSQEMPSSSEQNIDIETFPATGEAIPTESETESERFTGAQTGHDRETEIKSARRAVDEAVTENDTSAVKPQSTTESEAPKPYSKEKVKPTIDTRYIR